MQAEEFSVRQGRPEDRDALFALIAGSPDAPRWPASAWEAFLPSRGVGDELQRILFFAVGADDRPSGVLAATKLGSSTELEILLVTPAMRRHGLGRMLSTEWLAWAARQGGDEALLEVRASNGPAQRLYEQLGFRVEGRRSGYYREPSEDALLMRRSLPL